MVFPFCLLNTFFCQHPIISFNFHYDNFSVGLGIWPVFMKHEKNLKFSLFGKQLRNFKSHISVTLRLKKRDRSHFIANLIYVKKGNDINFPNSHG